MTLIDFIVGAYTIVGIGLMAQGTRYLVAGQFMHYHEDVIKERWGQLSAPERRLMLGLLKGFGAGMFCTGIFLTFSAIVPVRLGLFLARWFVAFLSVLYTLLLVHVTRQALLPGAAPIAVTIGMLVLCVLAALASIALQFF